MRHFIDVNGTCRGVTLIYSHTHREYTAHVTILGKQYIGIGTNSTMAMLDLVFDLKADGLSVGHFA